jgi:hypothetical protein
LRNESDFYYVRFAKSFSLYLKKKACYESYL